MAKLPGAVQGARIAGERFVRSQRQYNPEGRMPLMDHLRELRNRVVRIALALIAGMIIGFIFFNPVWHVIAHPLCSVVIRGQTGCNTLGTNQLVLTGPLDAFYLRVKVAVDGDAGVRSIPAQLLVLAVLALIMFGPMSCRSSPLRRAARCATCGGSQTAPRPACARASARSFPTST